MLSTDSVEESSGLKEFFSVRELKCRGNIRLNCEELFSRLRAAGALELWNLSLRELGIPISGAGVERFLRRDPWIEGARLEVDIWSRQGLLTIKEAVPWFVTELRGQTWVISRRGALLQELGSILSPELTVEVSQLPRVRGIEYRGADSVLREAERIKRSADLLSFLAEAGRLPFEVESYEILEDASFAITPFDSSFPTVFFNAESLETSRQRLRLLSDIISDARSRGESLQKVDLRLDSRAVVVK
jgi:hypothetical protein